MHRRAVNTSAVGARVDLDSSKLPVARIGILRLCTSQDCLDPGKEFSWIEWFWQVIVGTKLEANDSIDIIASSGQHNDRHLAALTNFLEHFKPAHTWQHDVEDQEIEVIRGE